MEFLCYFPDDYYIAAHHNKLFYTFSIVSLCIKFHVDKSNNRREVSDGPRLHVIVKNGVGGGEYCSDMPRHAQSRSARSVLFSQHWACLVADDRIVYTHERQTWSCWRTSRMVRIQSAKGQTCNRTRRV